MTNIVVGTQKVKDKSTGKVKTIDFFSYVVVVKNDSGTVRTFEVTRSSSEGQRGEYGKNREVPPGQYEGRERNDGPKGYRIELTTPGQPVGVVLAPDGTKKNNDQIHRNGGLSDGCLLFPAADRGRFEETISIMKQQDQDNNLGTNIAVTIEPRNSNDNPPGQDQPPTDSNIPGDADGFIPGVVKAPRVSPPASKPPVKPCTVGVNCP